jgi:UDP-N-acetylglucosamine transferase subunit ALG13
MIFVTVGTQLPFERLIRAADEWAGNNPGMPVIAQIGLTEYRPVHMEVVNKLDPETYQRHFTQAKVVVSHVGMGTIISGIEAAKPLVLMPRLAKFGEHRNDHQLGTAKKFGDIKSIQIAESVEELKTAITRALQQGDNMSGNSSLRISPLLLDKRKGFVRSVKAE